MAEAWIGDTFRIFPGKYGEDPLWGDAEELQFADGRNADEAFTRNYVEFIDLPQWRTLKPEVIFQLIDHQMQRRLHF